MYGISERERFYMIILVCMHDYLDGAERGRQSGQQAGKRLSKWVTDANTNAGEWVCEKYPQISTKDDDDEDDDCWVSLYSFRLGH